MITGLRLYTIYLFRDCIVSTVRYYGQKKRRRGVPIVSDSTWWVIERINDFWTLFDELKPPKLDLGVTAYMESRTTAASCQLGLTS